jgi:toxin ParE1/3/4
VIPAVKSSEFESDFERIALLLAEANTTAALGFVDAVEAAIELLCRFPEAGPIWPHGDLQRPIRFFVIPRYRNYLIFYRLESNELRLGRLLHGARNIADLLQG